MNTATRTVLVMLLVGLPLVAHGQDAATPTDGPAGQDLCVKPAQGPIEAKAESNVSKSPSATTSSQPIARVGKLAPDFEANAFVGAGFRPIRLSDYRGQWVVLCFYPGDFTFV